MDLAPNAPTPPRVRFAPSPTGLLHIGGLRTALYNYLLARGQGGAFLLRIEDTDQERFVEGAEADILESLAWAGLTFDEGPGVDGPHAPYHQSARSGLYREAVDRLVTSGHAYVAFDTKEEIEAMRAREMAAGDANPKVDARRRGSMANALTLPAAEVEARIARGEPHVVRLKVPEGEAVVFTDLVRGAVSIRSDELDDQVLMKSDGLPTYHLANVVDDHAMGITHVIRGEEWLPSTPKHVLLYRAFGWTPPAFAHLPLILSPNGGKLSKRNADTLGIPVSVRQYREAGYEPGALVNFLAFLGWNPGTEREVFTLDELTAAFSVERIGQSGVQFNLDKLRWYNQQFLRALTVQQLAERARPLLAAKGIAPDAHFLEQAALLLHDRIAFAHDLADDYGYFWSDPEAYDEAGVAKRWKPGATAGVVRAYADALEALETFSGDDAERVLRETTDGRGLKAADLIHPARLAVSGTTTGPGLFELMQVLGRDACVRRLRRAADALG